MPFQKVLCFLLAVFIAFFVSQSVSANVNTFDPTDSISFTGNAGFCPGKNLKLTAKYAPAGATYQWKKDGIDIGSATADSFVVTQTGTYTVVVNGTVNYPEVAVTAYASPAAAFSFSPDNVCVGTGIQFTNASTGASVYKWSFSDPNSADNSAVSQNPYHRFKGTAGNSTQIFAVKLVVQNSDGCTDSITKNVTLKQAPGTELKGTGAAGTTFKVCANVASPMNFVNNSSTAATNSNYVIQWGDAGTDFTSAAFGTATSHTYSVGTHDLLFIVTGNNGCIDTTKYTAFVGSNPSVSITNPGNTNICSDATLTFPITTGSNPPGTTYTLSFNDGSADSSFTHPAAAASVTRKFSVSSCGISSSDGTNTYQNSFKATLVASNPCGTSSGTVVPIYVSQKPNASFSVSPRDSICVNTIATFTNTSGSFKSISGTDCVDGNYVWSISPAVGWTITSGSLGTDNGLTDASLWTSGQNALAVRFTAAGTYTIKLKIGNELCGNSEVTKTICVNPAPTAAFSIDNVSGCTPVAVTTSNSSSAPNCGNNAYTWSVGYTNAQSCLPSGSSYSMTGGTSLVSAEPKFSFINPGVYTIGLTVTAPGGGCSTAAASKTVTVQTKPRLTLNSTGSVCQNANYNPSLSVVNCYTGNPAYSWSMPGASITSSTSQSPGPFSYATAGNKTITVEATNTCGTTSASQTVTVNAAPVVTVPANQIVCAGSSTGALSFSSSLSGTTYSWSNNTTSINLAASGTGSSINSFTAANNTGLPVSATVTVTPTANTCVGTAVPFTITVNPTPAAPSVSSPVAYCQNATASQLTAAAAGSNTLTWFTTTALVGGSVVAPTPGTTTSSTHYVTQTNSDNCRSPYATIQVNVTPAIANNSISSDQSICSGTAPNTINGSSPSGGAGAVTYTYQWQVSSDNGNSWSTISGQTGQSLTVGTLTQTTMYRRIVNSGACSVTSSAVTVSVTPVITGNTIAAAQTICSGTAPALLTGSIPAGGTGSFNYQWQSSAVSNFSSFTTLNGATSADYQPGTLSTTTYYRRVVSSGACSLTSSGIAVTVNPKPVMNAISDVTYCAPSTPSPITLSSNQNNNTVYTWTADNGDGGLPALSGTGNLPLYTTTNNSNPKVPVVTTVTAKGTYTANGVSCEGSAISFKITVLPKISVTPIADVTVCSGTAVSSLTPTADAGTFSGYTLNYGWAVSGSGTSLVAFTGTSIPSYSTSNNGSTELTTTITVTPRYTYNATLCTGNPDVYTILVKPVPSANAGADKSVCGSTSTSLSANSLLTGQTGSWTQVSGPGTAIFSNINVAAPTLSGLVQGDYVFNWRVSNGTCADANDQISVKVRNPITSSNAGPDDKKCDFNSAKDSFLLAANAAAAPYETGTWTLVSSPTGSTSVIRNPTSFNSYFVYDKAGTYILKWTITNDLSCTASSDNVSLVVYDRPLAGSLSASSSVCSGNAVTVSAPAAVASVLKWQYNPAPVNDNIWIDINNTTISNNFTNVTTAFDARIIMQSVGSGNGCTTTDTSAVISVSVDPITAGGNTASPATVCINNNSGSITLTGHTGSIVRWESSVNGGTTWSPIANTATVQNYLNLTTTTIYRAVIKSGVCPSANSGTTQITVVNTVTPSNAGADQKLCAASSASLSGNTPTVGTGAWSQISGPAASISNSAASSSTITGLQPNNTYVFRWLITGLGNCPSSHDDVQIINRPQLNAAAAGSDQIVCDLTGTKSVTLAGNAVSFPAFQSGTWSIAPPQPQGGTANFQSASQHNTSVTLNKSGNYFFVWTVSDDACPLSRDTVLMRIYDKPSVGSFGASATLCEGSSLTVSVSSSAVGSVLNWQIQPLPINAANWKDTATGSASLPFNDIKLPFSVRYIMQSLGSANGCSTKDTSAPYSVSVSPATVPGILTADTTVCHTLNSGMLELKTYTGSITGWETSVNNGASWTALNSTNAQLSFNGLSATTLYRAVVKSGVCPAAYSDTSIVTVVGPLTVPDAGTDNGYCGTGSINLQGNTPKNGEVGTWTQIKGSAVGFSNVNVPSALLSGLKIGSYSFEWMINNEVCPVKRDTVQIQILPDLFNAVDTLSKNICQGQSAQIKGQPASGGDGTYTFQWQRSSDNINWTNVPNATGQDLNFTPTVSLYVRRILQSASCSDISGSAYVLVKPSLGSFVASDSVSTCFPFTVKFTNLTLPSQATSWDFGDGFNGFGDTITHTFTTIGSYSVTMVAQHPGGCTYTATKQIIVSGPKGSGQYDKGPICGLKPVRFEATYSDADSIRWHFGDGTTLTTKEKIVYHSYQSAGPYLPVLELMAGAGGVCKTIIKGADTIKVDVIKAGYTQAFTENCGATPVAFNDTSIAYYGIKERSWSFGDNLTGSGKNPLHSYQSTGSYHVQLIAESHLGCRDTVVKTIALHVRDIPKITLSAAATGCAGKSVSYSAAVSAVDPLKSSLWQFSNSVTANGNSFTNTYIMPGNYSASFSATTQNGCADTVSQTITIHPTPATKTIDDVTICKGQSLQLQTFGAEIYSWGPVTGLTCSTCPSPVITPQGTITYIVTGSNSFGCQQKDTVTVNVIQPGKLSVNAGDSICIGESVQLSASGTQLYRWTPATGLSSDVSPTPTATPLMSTRYRVVGQDTLSCFTDTAYITIGVGNKPSLDLGPDKTVASGTLLPLTSSVTGAVISDWKWSPSANLSCTGCSLPVATIKNNITYSVSAATAYGCVAQDSIRIKVFCESTQVFIPNLFTPDGDGLNDVLMVRGTGIRTVKSFRVFNRWGELVFEKSNFSPNDIASGWDGKVRGVPASPDVYVYTCEVVCENNVPFIYKGNVTIIK